MVLGLAQRDPRHDRLKEAEHDELACLVGRDAAALEVEELRLVDRADRAGVCCPSAIRLVDLERGDGDRARVTRQVHPELAEEAVRADGALLDRDEALHVGPGPVEQRPLGEEVAGRVAPDVGRVRSQVEELLDDPKTISTCSTELRSPSRRLSIRLRTRRPPSWASAQWS